MQYFKTLLATCFLLFIAIYFGLQSVPEPREKTSDLQGSRSQHSDTASAGTAALSNTSQSQWLVESRSGSSSATQAETRAVTAHEKTKQALASLSNSEQQSLWQAFSEARREVRSIPEAWAERDENLNFDLYALHPKQHLTTRFGTQGVQIVSSDRTYTDADVESPSTTWQAQMRLLSFAGQSVDLVAQPEKSAQSSSKVEYRHQSALVEWYDNGVDGMEHGYTITTRPAGLGAAEAVSIEVAVDGLQVAKREDDGASQSLSFMDGEREVLSYSKLLVVDSLGNELPATMEPTASGFTLAYHDAGAVYPVIVDPLIVNEEAKLNRVNAAGFDNFGCSVAISGDYVIIGAYSRGFNESGSAYIFVRSGSSWLQQAKLNSSDGEAGDSFGNSVAISGDYAVVGADGEDHAGTSSGSAYVFVRSGTSWSEQEKLTASDAEASDQFGYSVGISGEYVIVGARYDDDAGNASGSAYIFVRSGTTWSQQEKLTASDAEANDSFGESVAISGDYVIVGAPDNGDAGCAYVFVRTGTSWSEQQKLTASDEYYFEQFGESVAISGDTVIVGASYDDDGGTQSGSAYIFVRSGTTWSQQAKLTASDAATNDKFGGSVAISGDYVVVGARFNSDAGTSSGSAYVFARSGTSWSQQEKLTASDAEAQDEFGGSVAISGDYVVAGARREGDSEPGSAYVYMRSGTSWSEQAKLGAPDTAADDRFGYSVGISGDTAVVGAYQDDDAGADSGSAYVFIRIGNSWAQQSKLITSDATAFDYFGYSVAIAGDFIIVGAYGDDDGGSLSGSAYVFERSGRSWSEVTKLAASDAGVGNRFGNSVAVSGDSAVVGAYFDNHAGTQSGSAYVFSRGVTSWFQEEKLTASDTEASDRFGNSVAIAGDTVVVGAPNDDDTAANSGSAYVFVRNLSSWSPEAKLLASDAAFSDNFGNSVAISGDSILVGAYNDDDGGSASGSAYVFVRDGNSWSQQAKLNASDATFSDRFGFSVAISDDYALIGAYGDDDLGSESGSVYLFVRSSSSWVQQAKFNGSDSSNNDRFGYSVGISGDSVIAGAYGDEDGGTESGSVYIYRIHFPIMLVFDHYDAGLQNGDAAPAFEGQLLGSEDSYQFSIGNAGVLDLDIQSISLGGANTAQFDLLLPDISSVADISTDQSLNFTILFHSTGSSSGLRNATVTVVSNDLNSPEFSFSISALGLSGVADEDSDGLNDWAEYSLSNFGFDWQATQSALVDEYYAQAHTAGLYTASEAAGVSGEIAIFTVDSQNNSVDLIIKLWETENLNSFTPMTLEPSKLSVGGDGNIRYKLDTAPGKGFFTGEWLGQ